jgi:hypothetical protein
MSREIKRICDMREGKALELFKEDDGDIIVAVVPAKGGYSKGVQFCSSGTQSPRTHHALCELMKAMEADEAEIPHNEDELG